MMALVTHKTRLDVPDISDGHLSSNGRTGNSTLERKMSKRRLLQRRMKKMSTWIDSRNHSSGFGFRDKQATFHLKFSTIQTICRRQRRAKPIWIFWLPATPTPRSLVQCTMRLWELSRVHELPMGRPTRTLYRVLMSWDIP